MKTVKTFGVIVLVFLLVACSPSAIPTDKADAQHAVDTMIYVKDSRTGLCFGVTSSYSITTGGGSTSMSIVSVPCEEVQELIKKNQNQCDAGLSC